MNTTEQVVLGILKEKLNNVPFTLPDTPIDWNSVYDECKNQSLLALTYPWIKQHDLNNPELTKKWTEKFASVTYRWYRMREAEKQLIQLLSEHGYVMAIIKGSSNSIYFPNPQLRISGDIDFLVRWEEYDAIYELLIQSGYKLVGEKTESKHHVAVSKNGAVFEMHKRPGGTRIAGKYANHEMVEFFQQGLDDCKTVNCLNYEIPVLPKLQTAMVLLLHTAQHLKEGLGLRHILDWMMFAKANVDDEFWYTELEAVAGKGNVDVLAKIMTKMCQKYLGLTDTINWCNDADEVVCDQFMEYVLQQGDFGIKVGDQDAEVRFLAESQDVRGFWRRLKNSSLYSMPIARKYIFLRPVAWMYQLFRYIRKGLVQAHPMEKFRVDKKQGNKRSRFFKNLGIKLD